jgi:hypothetical protein
MNERIQELMKQAGLSYLYDYDTDGHAMVCNEKDIKRFAELIVRECAVTAGLMEHEGRKGIGAQILDNFGVEK